MVFTDRRHPKGIALAASDDSGFGHGTISLAGLPPGYGDSRPTQQRHGSPAPRPLPPTRIDRRRQRPGIPRPEQRRQDPGVRYSVTGSGRTGGEDDGGVASGYTSASRKRARAAESGTAREDGQPGGGSRLGDVGPGVDAEPMGRADALK